jgi:uncharacterized membrane protein YgdD (TMEM256/DUF423 family)
MHKPSLTAGALFSALAVVIGAFGAHKLKSVMGPDAPELATFDTGVRYQFYHSLAILAAGLLHAFSPMKAFRVAAVLFAMGILLFSGSLYALVLLKATGSVGLGGLGIITPIGGLIFIAGWMALLMGIRKA